MRNKVKEEKLQNNFNREAAKISALLSGKVDKYEYLTGKEISPSDQSRLIEQAMFTNFPLGKAFENQIKTLEGQGIKQFEPLKALKLEENEEDVKSVEGIFPKEMRTNEMKN